MMRRGVQPVIELSTTSDQADSPPMIDAAESTVRGRGTEKLHYTKAALRAAELAVRAAVAEHDSCDHSQYSWSSRITCRRFPNDKP